MSIGRVLPSLLLRTEIESLLGNLCQSILQSCLNEIFAGELLFEGHCLLGLARPNAVVDESNRKSLLSGGGSFGRGDLRVTLNGAGLLSEAKVVLFGTRAVD